MASRVSFQDLIGDGEPQVFDYIITNPAGEEVVIGIKAIP